MKQSAAANRTANPAALLWCGLGLLVPRAVLLDALSPFGIGLAACGGAANLPTLLCVAVGYLLAGHVLSPFRYVAAVAMVAGGRWILDALPERGQQSFLPPLLAGISSAATGLIIALPLGLDGYRVLLLLAESVVAAGAALCFDKAISRPSLPLSAGDLAATAAAVAMVVSAAATVQVGGFSPGRVAAALLVLVCARIGRETGGCVAGCVLGGGLALTSPVGAGVAAAYAFGGLLAGVFARYGRVAQGLLFVVSTLLITLTETQEGLLILLYELFSAGVVFCLLPARWENSLHGLFHRQETPMAQGIRRTVSLRLHTACNAIEEVAESVEVVARRLSHHPADNDEANCRLAQIRQAVELQLSGCASLLRELARQWQNPHTVDVSLSESILRVCEDHGMTVEEVLCTHDRHGRPTVTLLTDDLPGGKWLSQIEQVCGCTLAPPKTTPIGDRLQVTLTQPPRYTVESGIARHVCHGETLCGDTARVCDVEDGTLALISDGMGSGSRAAVDSTLAAGITCRLWQAGFSADAVWQTVNAALMVKSEEETLATLDVAVVDTHSGRLTLYKAGAAPTLLRSGERISRLEGTGLPLGILPRVRPRRNSDTLSEGDVLLMVSDGALCGGVGVLEECLRRHPADGSMQSLAETMVTAALATEGHPDDVTAVALRLCRHTEEGAKMQIPSCKLR